MDRARRRRRRRRAIGEVFEGIREIAANGKRRRSHAVHGFAPPKKSPMHASTNWRRRRTRSGSGRV
jgi:hypothetical protein